MLGVPGAKRAAKDVYASSLTDPVIVVFADSRVELRIVINHVTPSELIHRNIAGELG